MAKKGVHNDRNECLTGIAKYSRQPLGASKKLCQQRYGAFESVKGEAG